MAAIRAAELDDQVILLDKSNPERSGCAATGIDHIWAYFPEIQEAEGVSLDDLVQDHVENIAKGLINRKILHYIAETSLDRILDLERFGARIRYDDSTLPGRFRLQYQLHRCRNTLHFDGRDVKRLLVRAARARGVEILGRIMVADLLIRDGQIAGAVGYGTRDGRLHLFRSKAVVMATGRPNRLYKTETGLAFNTRMPPALTGDGKAAMFRAGAEIINMEFVSIPGRWSSKNLVRGGGLPGGSYQPPGIGLNAFGEVIRPRNHELESYGEKWQGTSTGTGTGRTFMSELKAGRGPIFADMSWGSEADQEYMRWALSNEGSGSALLHLMDRYNLDFRRHKIEISPLEPEHSAAAAGGPIIDSNCQTTLPGLFAAGDEAGGIPQSVVPGALTMDPRRGRSGPRLGLLQTDHQPEERGLVGGCPGRPPERHELLQLRDQVRDHGETGTRESLLPEGRHAVGGSESPRDGTLSGGEKPDRVRRDDLAGDDRAQGEPLWPFEAGRLPGKGR